MRFVKDFRACLSILPVHFRVMVWSILIGPSLLLVPLAWWMLQEFKRSAALLQLWGVALDAGAGEQALRVIEPALFNLPSLVLALSVLALSGVSGFVSLFCLPWPSKKR